MDDIVSTLQQLNEKNVLGKIPVYTTSTFNFPLPTAPPSLSSSDLLSENEHMLVTKLFDKVRETLHEQQADSNLNCSLQRNLPQIATEHSKKIRNKILKTKISQRLKTIGKSAVKDVDFVAKKQLIRNKIFHISNAADNPSAGEIQNLDRKHP
ncbi:hypothetical protein HELRODRAFT_169058 [Helobdella robusta]|uniref:Uncharacterized protein n=1 Tax=Helobdella robusta TaxID=6412 RepID=T1F1C2_HELRO|nr:hypothetical protein HELRODRAFT_169058 [Helobdella robusta]ESO09117.1 hypothetical protein HELRODRAFT_169058 [Helobdella robusta]